MPFSSLRRIGNPVDGSLGQVARRLTPRWLLERLPKSVTFRRILPVLIAAFGLLVMPTLVPYVGTGLDPSWSIAINMATARRMAFGTDVIFTFGPLGFLATPALIVPRFGVLAMMLRFALSWMFGWLTARSLLRTLWWPVVAMCTWFLQWAVVGGSSGGAETMLIPVLLLFLGLSDALATRDRPITKLALASCAVACSTCLLMKFDMGLLCLMVLSGFLVAEGIVQRRSLRSFGVGCGWALSWFVASLLGWWLVLRQPLDGLWRWVSTSIDLLIGYQAAMVSDAPVHRTPLHSILTVGFVAVVAIGGSSLFLRDRRRSVSICVLTFGTLYLFAKQSFTRYDDGHLQRLYTCAAVVLVAIVGGWSRKVAASSDQGDQGGSLDPASWSPSTLRPSTRDRFAGGRAAGARIVCSTVAVAGSMYFANIGSDLVSALKPNVRSWQSVFRLAFSGAKRDAVITRQRTYLPPELSIPPEVRAALSEGGVHIEPTETSIAWIFPEIKWKPLPTLQSYTTYTAALDNVNAAAYQKRGGPDIVLYRDGFRVDDRIARFESPATQFAFICNFRPRVLTDLWQVFVRRPDGSGCADRPNDLGTVTTHLGEKVEVGPFPDDAVVVASFKGISTGSLANRVRNAVVRAPKFWFAMGVPELNEPAHRFIAATAGQPHVLSVPKCLRGAWSTYDTRSYDSFSLRETKEPRTDGTLGAEITISMHSFRYKCPT